MTTRKLNKAQEIGLLKNELEKCANILEGKVKKAETVGLTAEDIETARYCRDFITKNAPTVKAFYAI